MINEEQKQDIIDILTTSIECSGYSNAKINITRDEEIIKTTQTYWPQYIDKDTGKPFRYPFIPDCDMSDFACDFYEIIYKDILNDIKLVDDNGNFTDKNFAGDTMTSVSKLPGLKDRYHCLANFWLIPMEIGRTSTNEWSKTSKKYEILDFMDRFLLLLKYNYHAFENSFRNYFNNIKRFEQFSEIHFIKNSYVDENYDVNEYSHQLDSTTSEILFEFMKIRATLISESKYAEELWNYFNDLHLFKKI